MSAAEVVVVGAEFVVSVLSVVNTSVVTVIVVADTVLETDPDVVVVALSVDVVS